MSDTCKGVSDTTDVSLLLKGQGFFLDLGEGRAA